MRHEIIDANQLELTDRVVSIKRVSKTVKGGRSMRFTALVVVVTEMVTSALVLEKPLKFRKQSAKEKKTL